MICANFLKSLDGHCDKTMEQFTIDTNAVLGCHRCLINTCAKKRLTLKYRLEL